MRYLYIIFVMLIFSCSEKQNNGKEKRNTSTLPKARGDAGELLIVMDSTEWQASLGLEIKKVFFESLIGLPRPEPVFHIRHVHPSQLNSVLKNSKNILFAGTLHRNNSSRAFFKNLFDSKLLERIQQDTSIYTFSQTDLFARGQFVMFLVGNEEPFLIRKIQKNKHLLQERFNSKEEERLAEELFRSPNTEIASALQKDHAFSMSIPVSYIQVKNEKNFVWFRTLGAEIDKNIFCYYEPYTDARVFKQADALRKRIVEQWIVDPEKKNIYMTNQNVLPFLFTEVNFQKKYAVETKGMWKLSDNSRGGAFISYTFVDSLSHNLYYIEGYVDAPAKDKRELMRELKVILQTFSTRK